LTLLSTKSDEPVDQKRYKRPDRMIAMKSHKRKDSFAVTNRSERKLYVNKI
jgi:hypothetical protein